MAPRPEIKDWAIVVLVEGLWRRVAKCRTVEEGTAYLRATGRIQIGKVVRA